MKNSIYFFHLILLLFRTIRLFCLGVFVLCLLGRVLVGLLLFLLCNILLFRSLFLLGSLLLISLRRLRIVRSVFLLR